MTITTDRPNVEPKPYSVTFTHSTGDLSCQQVEEVAERMAAEWPAYRVNVEHFHSPGEVAQHALRQVTRETYPDVAALLDAGDVKGASETFLAHLEG